MLVSSKFPRTLIYKWVLELTANRAAKSKLAVGVSVEFRDCGQDSTCLVV